MRPGRSDIYTESRRISGSKLDEDRKVREEDVFYAEGRNLQVLEGTWERERHRAEDKGAS